MRWLNLQLTPKQDSYCNVFANKPLVKYLSSAM